MKRYGYNWLTVLLAVLLFMGAFHTWGRQISDCLTRPDRIEPLWKSVAHGVSQAFGWTLIWFLGARAQHNAQQRAQHATED